MATPKFSDMPHKANSPFLFLKIKLLIGIFLFQWHIVSAQSCFRVAGDTVGCSPFTVRLNNCTRVFEPNSIRYRFADNLTFQLDSTFTYTLAPARTLPDTFKIWQKLQISARADSSLRRVIVYPSLPPQFSVKLCQNQTIQLQILDTVYDEYVIDWGDNQTSVVAHSQPPISKTYGATRTFRIKVRGRYTGLNCGGVDSSDVNILRVLPQPFIDTLTTTATGLELKMRTDANFTYEILPDGSNTPLATFAGINGLLTQTIPVANATSQVYCLRVRIRDICGNALLSSNVFCSVHLRSVLVNAAVATNDIEWSVYPATAVFGRDEGSFLYRNRSLYQPFFAQETTYSDSRVFCEQEYCYWLEKRLSSPLGNFVSRSQESCVISKSRVQPTRLVVYSSVETPRSIRLFWQIPPDQPRITNYQITRIIPGTNTRTPLQSTTPRPELLDTDLKIDRQYCYEIRYENVCGNLSPVSIRTCPVFLSGNLTSDGNIQLNWTIYEAGAETYIVEVLDNRGQVIRSESAFSVPQYLDTEAKSENQIVRYRIKTVIDAQNNIFSYSNIIEVKQKFRIFFPNAFKPDGLNNTFFPKTPAGFVRRYKITIYDRLGEVMFSTQNLQDGWDGNYKGKPAEWGTYIYLAEVEDNSGEKYNLKGTFVLIR
ncbi:MAG: gliding motility-associated C-terminal domain-containing protein [Microscillaceae bacterium]|jgi:gliding motility-associated-like protein|nr:gliding motility-associated C-terminal domain-containing protein [Microscillaceae bacterium]